MTAMNTTENTTKNTTATATANTTLSTTVNTALRRYPFLPTLALLLAFVVVNASLQANFFEPATVNSTLRTMLPRILLTVGQTIVIIAGGIDLSVGTMVSMINAVMVSLIRADSTPAELAIAMAAGLAVGLLAGALNGFAVAVLRLQPIVTTYATSFIFSGIALAVLERPGGQIPRPFIDLYRNPQLFGIPTAVFVIAVVIAVWLFVRHTRYGQYIFAVGSSQSAAYATGVNVGMVRLSTYMVSGAFAFLAALALTLLTGTGDPRLGDDMTLITIVAVVLGGTALAGGRGGIAGPMMGVAILYLIDGIISFARIDTWIRDLVDAGIILTALAMPGVLGLLGLLRHTLPGRRPPAQPDSAVQGVRA
jgi:ribose transport system permease protein